MLGGPPQTRGPISVTDACQLTGWRAFAEAIGVQTASIKAAGFTASTDAPTCRMQARAVAGLLAVVCIKSMPQPYFRLERQAVEEAEVFTPRRQIPVPEHIVNLGIDAYWFSQLDTLKSTEGKRMITVQITWPYRDSHRPRRLAITLTRAYL